MVRTKGVVIGMLGLVLAGFGLSARGVPPSAAQAPVAIRTATEVGADSLAFWWAEEEGIYRKHGLRVTDTMHQFAFLGLLAIGSGQGDTSFQSDPPTATNIAKGIDAVVIAMIARGPEIYKLLAKKEIKGIRELVGKRVAWAGGSGGEFAATKYFRGQNIDVKSLRHVDLQPAEAVPLLDKGDLDAIYYWEPWPRKSLELGKDRIHVLATSRGVYEANMLLAVRRAFAQENPEAVRNFLRALIEATAAVRANPEKAAAIYQRRLRVGPKEAREAMGDYDLVVGLDAQIVPTLQEVAAWLQGAGKIKEAPNWRKIIDARYLRAVAPEAVRDFPW